MCVCDRFCILPPVDPPQITQHPTNQMNVVRGSQVTFTVDANTDAGTLTYQWQLDGASLDSPPVGVFGAATNTLTIECVQESNTGPVADPSTVSTESATVLPSAPTWWVTLTERERLPSSTVYNTGLKPITATVAEMD